MPGEAPLSEGVDFFGGSQLPEELTISPSQKKTEEPNEPVESDEEGGDVVVSRRSARPDPTAKDGDGDDAGDDEDGDEGDDGGDSEDEADEAPEKKGETQQVAHERKKSVLIRTARKEFKMPPNAKAIVRVDGKDEEVPLSELMSGYSSSKGIVKRLETLSQKEKALDTEKTGLKKHFDTFREKIEKDGSLLLPALGELLDENGIDPLPVAVGLRRSIAKSIMEMIRATPEQLRFVDAQLRFTEMNEETRHYRAKVEKINGREKEVAQQNQLMSEVNRVMQKSGMENISSFQKSFEALKSLKTEGKLKLEDITPDDVGHQFVVTQLVEDFFPELENDTEAQIKLFKFAREFGATSAELKKVAQSYLSSGEQDSAGEKKAVKPKTVKPSGTKANKLEDLFI